MLNPLSHGQEASSIFPRRELIYFGVTRGLQTVVMFGKEIAKGLQTIWSAALSISREMQIIIQYSNFFVKVFTRLGRATWNAKQLSKWRYCNSST